MFRTLLGLVILVITEPLSFAQEAAVNQLRLLNPDGTPAVDAKAVAILQPGVTIDYRLPPLPTQLPPSPLTKEVENLAGVLFIHPNAKALVARSDQGFVFVPLDAKPTIARLRPWAKLKINIPSSSLPADLRQGMQLIVIWQNNFAGQLVRPMLVEVNDPFGGNAGDDPFGGGGTKKSFVYRQTFQGQTQKSTSDSPPVRDWRLDNLVTWQREVDLTDQIVEVPPGEVMVVLRSGHSNTTDKAAPLEEVLFKPLRTTSGKLAEFTVPQFASATGILADDESLPDWNRAENASWIQAQQLSPEIPGEFFAVATRTPAAVTEMVSKFYASPAGMEFRYGLYPIVVTRIQDDGKVIMRYIPLGEYQLKRMNQDGSQALQSSGLAANGLLKVEDGEVNALGTLTPKGPTRNTRAADLPTVQAAADPFGSDPFGSTPARPVTFDDSFDDSFGDPAADPFGPGAANPPKRPLPPKAGFSRRLPPAEAEQKIKAALMQTGYEYHFHDELLSEVIALVGQDLSVPILINERALSKVGIATDVPVRLRLTPMSGQSILRQILSSISDELTYIVRDEVLLITTKDDAGEELDTPAAGSAGNDANRDTGDQFIKQWLESASDTTDSVALRAALQTHLEQEFDTNQKTRQAELQRLEQLLEQARKWNETRHSRRRAIIDERLQELLQSRQQPGQAKSESR